MRSSEQRVLRVVIAALAAVGASCAGDDADPGLDDPWADGVAESTAPLAPATCTSAEVCTAPNSVRASCFVAVNERDVRREVAQTFSVSRPARAGKVRLALKKLYPAPAGQSPRLTVELRELESGKVPLDAARTIATATLAAESIPSSDQEVELSFTSTASLVATAPGGPPRYALVLKVENGQLAVGVGCGNVGNIYAGGDAWQRPLRRISPTTFSNPPFTVDPTPKDLSFAFTLACDEGLADCDLDGSNWCETNIAADVTNCGSCGVSCSTNHMATRTCTAERCSGTCATGWGDCNSDKQSDGCETNTTSNAAHCGACGNVCAAANAGSTCASGQCQISACAPGYFDLDGQYANGCECQHVEAAPNACASPTTLTALSSGSTTFSGQIPTDTAGAQGYDFVQIDVPLGSGTWGSKFGSSASSALSIQFTNNPDGAFRFDVLGGPCVGTNRPCSAAGGVATGLTSYGLTDNRQEAACTYYTQSQVSFAGGATSPSVSVACGCTTNPGTGTNGAVNLASCRVRRDSAGAAITWNQSFLLRVYRTGAPTSCADSNYTLSISRT
jgi:hypothetical protein